QTTEVKLRTKRRTSQCDQSRCVAVRRPAIQERLRRPLPEQTRCLPEWLRPATIPQEFRSQCGCDISLRAEDHREGGRRDNRNTAQGSGRLTYISRGVPFRYLPAACVHD